MAGCKKCQREKKLCKQHLEIRDAVNECVAYGIDLPEHLKDKVSKEEQDWIRKFLEESRK